MPHAKTLELQGDLTYREAVVFQLNDDGSLRIWIDGGEGGDTEMGFYGIDAERTFSADDVAKIKAFLELAGK